MKPILYIAVIFLWSPSQTTAQEHFYEEAYVVLSEMLVDDSTYSFKKAVITVENAYHFGLLDTTYMNFEIAKLTTICKQIVKDRDLKDYPFKDKDNVEKYAALYTVMTDTIPLKINGEDYEYWPFSYDFNDIWGNENWENMFVSKLLYTGKGNCHSLPYLYKILAEEMGVDAHLALAPNHIYIKHRNEKDGWYNTELTSGFFPVDAWIMASGYVHLDGIKNSIYMKALNNKESIALLLVDLAQGYEKKFPINDGNFILKCIETALTYYPNLITAHLLKLEMTRKKLEQLAVNEEKQIDEIIDSPKAEHILNNLTYQATTIHDLGYRQMPKEMYLDWLVSLKEEQEKYINKEISTLKNQKKK